MAFGKPGRPAEDQLARQREIYEAVSPLILDHGVRRLSMRMAARATCFSVGGLYHHFGTKNELVLHGLQPETIARCCQDFHESTGDLAISDPPAFLNAYCDWVVDMVDFIRPAVYAALELGFASLEETLEPTLSAASDQFTARFRTVFPDADENDLYRAGRAIHRALVSALFDKRITRQELRDEITALINSYLVVQHASRVTTAQANPTRLEIVTS